MFIIILSIQLFDAISASYQLDENWMVKKCYLFNYFKNKDHRIQSFSILFEFAKLEKKAKFRDNAIFSNQFSVRYFRFFDWEW